MIATTLRGRPPEQKAEIVRRFVEDALPGFEDGTLRPVVDRVLPRAEAPAAHRAMEAGENVGKIVLQVALPAGHDAPHRLVRTVP